MTVSSVSNPDSEAALEQAAIDIFHDVLEWQVINAEHETYGKHGTLGRETPQEVVLIPRLRDALITLNPDVPLEGIQQAIEELVKERGTMSMVAANRDVYDLLKDGVKVTVPDESGEGEVTRTVKVIDWETPENNDFLLVQQFWVHGELYKRRADLVGFVNGLPLVFIELKGHVKRLENAFRDNFRDYKNTIPKLFWYNAFVILSNGSESRMGTITAEWGHFAEWKKINDEGEEGVVSLETMIRGTCEQTRLLDLVENFTLFSEEKQGVSKLIAKNHQYLGVNNAIEAVKNVRQRKGKLGVFWHTQGSGKSYSMVFFSQKVLRKIPGNWTFAVITDRVELDEQIYRTFARCGAVTKGEVHAKDGEHLKQLLREDNRYIFTLIQKFHTPAGETYPKLSDRDDVIVMTDEAHRSQYDIFALNMRNALPNAAFIGFTGTPLMAGEEHTKEVFGDYVSVYNFAQAVQDGATVPLYYENRVPELQLTNEELNEDMQDLIERAELNEKELAKLEREYSREYHLITRDERLEKVAEDIVAHFIGRGHFGKAMVVSIDKATAVRMHDKVKKYWNKTIDDLEAKLLSARKEEADPLSTRLAFMKSTDMAVVVSQAQNEEEDFEKLGLSIRPHRERMVKEALDEKFKDSRDPLRIVFVCAMWMTGFDAPSVSTIYLDKPMRNHTLMQTIARANRVWGQKNNGLIVDYVGVFRHLQKALAIYGTAKGGTANEDEQPIKDKSELIAALRNALNKAEAFCQQHDVDVEKIKGAQVFERIRLTDDAKEAIIVNDETKRNYLSLASDVDRLYKAILPDEKANAFNRARSVIHTIAEKIRSTQESADISEVMDDVNVLLDLSVAAEEYVIRQSIQKENAHLLDLTEIDFEKLKEQFKQGRKRTEAEKLRALIERNLNRMVRVNKTRMDYYEKFQQMIEEWNKGAKNVEQHFQDLSDFAQDLTVEEQRHVAEGLSEEELSLFDLLTKQDVTLSKNEIDQLKRVAHDLLTSLKREKLILDWRRYQQSRAAVRVHIEAVLDTTLPDAFDANAFEKVADDVFEHVFEAYARDGRNIFNE